MTDIQVTLHPSPENQRLLQTPLQQQEISRRKKILLVIIQGVLVFLGILISTIALAKSSIQFSESQKNQVVRRTTYERIGNTDCPNIPGTSTLYIGVTIGYKTSTGYTGFQCMPTYANIKYYPSNESTYNSTEQIYYGNITEYKTFTRSNNLYAACAVCKVKGRGSTVVLPGTYECLDPSWTKEYDGYLMTGNTCVDKEMEGLPPTTDPKEEPTLRHEVVTADINIYYQNQQVLSCVVCSM